MLLALVAGCAPYAMRATTRTVCPAPTSVPWLAFPGESPAQALGRAAQVAIHASFASAAYRRCLTAERRERADTVARIARLEREVAELREASAASRRTIAPPTAQLRVTVIAPGASPPSPYEAPPPNPYESPPPNPYDR